MSALQLLWHLLNFGAVAALMAGIGAGLAKALWRRELASRPWWRLALPAFGLLLAVQAAGALLLQRDGAMLTYGAMVLVLAGWLGLSAFGRFKPPR